MRVIRKVVQQTELEITDDILCNLCGASCLDKYARNFEGLIEAHLCGGYGSKIGDSVEVEFSICEPCLLGLFDRFVIGPKFVDTLWGDELEKIAMEKSGEKEETQRDEGAKFNCP